MTERPREAWCIRITFSVIRKIEKKITKLLFRQSLTGCNADVAETMDALNWLYGRAVSNFVLSLLLPVPRTCLPTAAVYLLWAFSVPQPSVLGICSYLCLLLLSFPWLLRKSHQTSSSFSFATWRINSFLQPLPKVFSWYLPIDHLGLPRLVQPPMP